MLICRVSGGPLLRLLVQAALGELLRSGRAYNHRAGASMPTAEAGARGGQPCRAGGAMPGSTSFCAGRCQAPKRPQRCLHFG
eukprot:scaffold1254_cov376-Prasinococcus_capsulatus_cf.AAC.3